MVLVGPGCRAVDFYPMTSHLGPGLFTIPVKNYEICLLLRHMTINAVARDLVIQLWEHSGFRFVATQTTLRERCQIMLAGVNVVTSQAGHGRLLEAAAFFQQFDLAAVHVNLLVRIGPRQLKRLVERFAGKIGESFGKRNPVARMAPGAEVDLSGARKFGRIEHS